LPVANGPNAGIPADAVDCARDDVEGGSVGGRSVAATLDTVNDFLDLTNNRKDVARAVALLAPDVTFDGPLMRISGVDQYAALLDMFLPAHLDTRILHQFEDGDDACSVGELDVRSPAGETITLAMSEWFRLRDGKIAEHRVYYDPREFERAFGLAAEKE
jgi:ketosteroid isomerase-like protein